MLTGSPPNTSSAVARFAREVTAPGTPDSRKVDIRTYVIRSYAWHKLIACQ